MNAELFWSKVNNTEESDDLCWEWTGHLWSHVTGLQKKTREK